MNVDNDVGSPATTHARRLNPRATTCEAGLRRLPQAALAAFVAAARR